MDKLPSYTSATASEIAKQFDEAKVSAIGMSIDDYLKTLHQTKAVIATISDENRGDLSDWVVNNVLWLIADKLDELENALIVPADKATATA